MHRKLYSTSIFHSIFPSEGLQFYFNLFGKAGFHEYQALIPDSAFSEYVKQVKSYLRKNQVPITLASAKYFLGQQRLLRFNGAGTCFALNMPKTGRAGKFMAYLDNLIIELGGIPNIIKDSRLPASVVKSQYPEYQDFKESLLAHDPKRLYTSELSERLGL
jgi:decaprenylphospho-beta-D-ribofuranose 2-oxidase